MFTGIIETLGIIREKRADGTNIHFEVESELTSFLKVDQSVSHNGVCLTVVELKDSIYVVTAIEETLLKTNLNDLSVGDSVNLERAMKLGDRLDGHLVQGHVDQIGVCENISEKEGSWQFKFSYDGSLGNITIEKGSITINGVSLTVVNSSEDSFEVAIIPYTFEHTNFNAIEKGSKVNLEFDVIGKYLKKLMPTQFKG